MARLGRILAQNRSHGLWEASGTPPGPPNPDNIEKSMGFLRLGVQGLRATDSLLFALY